MAGGQTCFNFCNGGGEDFFDTVFFIFHVNNMPRAVIEIGHGQDFGEMTQIVLVMFVLFFLFFGDREAAGAVFFQVRQDLFLGALFNMKEKFDDEGMVVVELGLNGCDIIHRFEDLPDIEGAVVEEMIVKALVKKGDMTFRRELFPEPPQKGPLLFFFGRYVKQSGLVEPGIHFFCQFADGVAFA